MNRIFTMTRQARAAILSEHAQGLTLALTHIAIGSGRYTPADTRVALQAERLRLPIGESQKDAAALQLNLASVFRGPPEFFVSEIGVYAGEMLVFVWSDPAADAWVTFLKSDLDFLLNVAITTPDLPEGAIEIVDSGQALGLNLAPLNDAVEALQRVAGYTRVHPFASWDFRSTEGWTTQAAVLTAFTRRGDSRDGARVTGDDVDLISPPLKEDQHITGADYPLVLIEVVNDGQTALTNQRLYYGTFGPNAHNNFSVAYSAFPVGGVVPIEPGESRLLLYDMRELAPEAAEPFDWMFSRISSLRWAPHSGPQSFVLRRVQVLGPDGGAELKQLRAASRALGMTREHPVSVDFNRGLAGWTADAASRFVVGADGQALLEGGPAGGSFVLSPMLEGRDLIVGAEFPLVLMEVVNTGTVPLNEIECRGRPLGGAFGATWAIPVGGLVPIEPGERRTVVWDMRQPFSGVAADWTGALISQLRFDMTNTVGQAYRLLRIQVLGPGVEAVTTLTVDGANGNDAWSGTLARPLATLVEAIRRAPDNRHTVINLVVLRSVHELAWDKFRAADAYRIPLRGRSLTIQGPGIVQADWPVIRFPSTADPGTRVQTTARFSGSGTVTFIRCRVEIPTLIYADATFVAQGGIASNSDSGFLSINYSACALILSNMPAHISSPGGHLSLLIRNTTVTFAAGLTGCQALWQDGNAPTSHHHAGGSAPAGVTYKSLVGVSAGALLLADGTPRGLLSNLSFA